MSSAGSARPRMQGELSDYLRRYSAQTPVIGIKAQKTLGDKMVLVNGAGRMGSTIIFNLAAVGVGKIVSNDYQNFAMENCNVPFATDSLIGKPKVLGLAKMLQKRAHFTFVPVVASNDSPELDFFYRNADLVICCANSLKGRMVAAERAIKFGRTLLDVAVSDGRSSLKGFVKLWAPEFGARACPA